VQELADELGRGKPGPQPWPEDDGVVVVVEDPGERGLRID
jgi:hypothetical protein